MINTSIIKLSVPYNEKDRLKSFGIKWNSEGKFWHTSRDNPYLSKLDKYLDDSYDYYDKGQIIVVLEYEPFKDNQWKWVQVGNPLHGNPKSAADLIATGEFLIGLSERMVGIVSKAEMYANKVGAIVFFDLTSILGDTSLVLVFHFDSDKNAEIFIKPIERFLGKHREPWLIEHSLKEAGVNAYSLYEEDELIEDHLRGITVWT